ncbi:cytochrome b N-terminal domain-containing protein [Desulfopila sp. IMCC35008]|uniref:cytochrome b N-terminal domain-containing protein n=1 Tax=Desulfopila sp. IMCC35008 TaxID=2653858 RepID=UPI0013D74F4C|nr:cytochrome b N-terminal domain-containing protein [Desulfopila sp. IMCC35008]
MNHTRIIDTICALRWGSWCLVSLYISLLSGVIVGLQYNPSEPFYSVTAIDLLVPYGAFFRSLHFYSSQGFFLFALIHFLCVYDATESYTFQSWLLLMITFPVIIFLLFTGYVLRGDNTGFSAGMIAEAILLTIPFIGTLLNDLLFAVTEQGMQRVYLHHVISLDLLFLFLAWDHLRRYRVRVHDHIPFICLTLLFCACIAAPLEPERIGESYIAGPWFFLGLQELLRYFHPLFAGVVYPLLFLTSLLSTHKSSRLLNASINFSCCWLLLYLLLSIVAWIR